MARFNAAFEKGGNYNRFKKALAIGLGSAALSSAVLYGAAPANADAVVGFGGMGDPSGQAYGDMLRATGQLGPNDTYHAVPYPASIAPLGPVTLEQSLNEAMVNANPVIDDARRNVGRGEKLVIRGYSEGGIAAARKAQELYGGSVTPGMVIIDGAPVSDVGMFNPQDPLVKSVLPMITDMISVPTHDRAPAGTILRSSEQDVWAMGGPSDIGRLLGQGMDTFMGPAHAVQNERAPYYTWVGEDGIIHHTFPGLGTGGAAPNGVTMGGPAVGAPAPEVAPAPVRNEDHPRWVPNAPNFEAKIRVQPTEVQSQPSSTRQESVVTKTNGTRKDGTARKSVVRSHVSMNFSTHQ
jgi:hypothetical protein